jgi:AAA+ superfamily predicted ATPase
MVETMSQLLVANRTQQAQNQARLAQLGGINSAQSGIPSNPNGGTDPVPDNYIEESMSDTDEETKKRRDSGDIHNLRIRDLRDGDVLLNRLNNIRLKVERDRANVNPGIVKVGSWEFGKNDTSKVVTLLGDVVIDRLSNAKAAKKGVGFDSVILEDHKKEQIVEAIAQVDNHDLIFNKWGFKDVFEKGTAISLLFYGPPGTGKTLMAQAIADKYDKKLKVITTAEIETPEPGGAERNIAEAFTEANKGDTVLLFDECDGLITDRSRVGMILAAQINALLMNLEKYTGIVVFTTNRLEALDPAFDRRLSLKLEFEMPDASRRKKIWKRMFPEGAPLAKDIRWDDLAEIEIAGGHIKNVVLKAARKAANLKMPDSKKMITDEILWDALEKEVESMESYSDALASYNPWYGTPMKGGAGANVHLKRSRGALELVRGKSNG